MKQARQPPTPLRSPPPRRMAGLSLIELMISITIGLMILSGVAFVFVNSSSARNEVERTSRQIENGRYAVEVMSDDLRLAGFYGELDVGTVGPPVELPLDQCSLTATHWNAWIRLHVQGFDNGTAPLFIQTLCPLTNHKADTDILVIRRARTCLAGIAGCDGVVSGKPYVQVSLCATDVTQHKLGKEGTETFDLKKKDCTSTADKRQYLVYIYYISTDNGSGQNVPTLKRLELAGADWTTTALVEGIEQFNVLYGIDTDGNGAPDSYSANPATIANWLDVVTVQFYILARNLEKSPDYTQSKTYSLGAGTTPITVADGYRRHVYSSLVRLSNPAGRRDAP